MASKSKKNGRHDGSPGENDVLAQFLSVTGASEEVATNMLEACNNELDMAIGMYLDSGLTEDGGGGAGGSGGGRGGRGVRGGGGRSSAGGAGTSSSSSPKRNGGKKRSKTNSPTEDEAFEDGEDFVRAPIPQKMEQLVDDMVIVNPKRIPSIASTKVRSVFDGFRDFRREAEEQQRAMLSGETSSTNASPSSSSSSSSPSFYSSSSGKKPSKKLKTLEELFRPPVDMLFPGTFIGAREEGKAGNLWLLINIQNHKEFACQCLNRDIWSHGAIRDIVRQHFVFWQVYHDSAEGVKYEQFYPIGEYPYVAILDPRTGERLLTLNTFDALSFSETVTEFLREHPSPDGTSSTASNANRSNSSTAASTSSASLSTSQFPFASTSAASSFPSSPGGKRKIDTDSSSSASRGETSSSSSSSSHPNPKKGRFTAEAALEGILDESEDSQLQAAIRASLAHSDEKPGLKSGKSGKESSSSSSSKNKSSNARNTRPSEESEMTESDEDGSETEGELETFSSSDDEGDDEKTKDSKASKKPEEKSTAKDAAPCGSKKSKTSSEASKPSSEASEASKPNAAQSLNSSNNESGNGDADESVDDEDVVGASASDDDDVVGGGADLDGWRRWCASEAPQVAKTKIIFRLPDGARDQLELVPEAPLLTLTLFANSKGFSAERFELVTNFPRKKLSYMDGEATLKAVGIIGQETVFVQEREIPLAN